MKIRNLLSHLYIAVFVGLLVGCESIPPEQQKNYALIESRIGEFGGDMDANRNQMVAYISYIDGRPRIAGSEINLPPGPYRLQVGLACGNTATCHPSRPYEIAVEAGKRYVLKPDGVYVSDRFGSRQGEVCYQPPKG